MLIKDLIEKLQKIRAESNIAAHGEPIASFSVEFPNDPDLDDEYWDVKSIDIDENLRIGCACVDGVSIKLLINRM